MVIRPSSATISELIDDSDNTTLVYWISLKLYSLHYMYKVAKSQKSTFVEQNCRNAVWPHLYTDDRIVVIFFITLSYL